MSSGITSDDRQFSVRDKPWHYAQNPELVTIFADYDFDRDTAREASGTAWNPITLPVATLKPSITPGVKAGGLTVALPSGALWVPEPGRKVIVRNDTFASLGHVTDEYQLISNDEVWSTVDAMLEADPDRVQIETAGTLDGGKTVWVLAKLDGDFAPDGDPSATQLYMLIVNSYDGRSSMKCIITNIRVVCKNTLKMAEMNGQARTFSFAHRGSDLSERIAEAKTVLGLVKKQAEANMRLGSALSSFKVSEKAERKFVDTFIPDAEYGASDRVIANVEDRRATVLRMLKSKTCEGIRGTSYGLFQAGIEFLDHGSQSNNAEALFKRTMMDTEPRKRVALALSLDVAHGMTAMTKTRVMALANA